MFPENQAVHHPFLKTQKVSLYIKREDTWHPFISGNKYRKLKYNLQAVKKQGYDTLLTFGGAFSNHIAATAYAGREYGIRTIGVIRGEELEARWEGNPTLRNAREQGMHFHFVSREKYREKDDPDFIRKLQEKFGPCYILPEGGTNALAVKGCAEILGPGDADFFAICVAVGTGGTLAGLARAAAPGQQVLGFPALKGDFLEEDIRKFAPGKNWSLVPGYHFGGYGKVTPGLIAFMNDFREVTGIPLDALYTAKMLYGIFAEIKKGRFPEGSRILAVHTGGLQGNTGMNRMLKRKNLPLITV